MNCILRSGQNIVCTLASSAANENRSLALSPTSTSIESFDTSTAYLRATVTCGLINVAYSFFSAPGVPPCNDKESVGFTSSNNAWCVVANLTDDSPDEAPFLFTKNLSLSSLDDDPILTSSAPFGKAGCVVVFKGGSGGIMTESEIKKHLQNLNMTNRILRP